MHDVAAQTAIADNAATRPRDALRDEYGSRRGWLTNLYWSLAARAGALRTYRSIDWLRVRQFVFVCQGNICRSPYAARRARAAGFAATSCGLEIRDNATVDPMAAAVARRRGLDLSQHQPRAISRMRPAADDLIVVMEPAQLSALRAHTGDSAAQVTLLGGWTMPRKWHLTDPFGLSEEYFNRCFMLIDSAIVGMGAAHAEAIGDARER